MFSVNFQEKKFKTKGKHSSAVSGSLSGEKQLLLIFVPFYCFEQKGLFTTNPNFLLDLALFKLFGKNKLSKYIWASFWDSHFFDYKEKFSVNFPEIASKTQESIV